jgi:hypothetical protein
MTTSFSFEVIQEIKDQQDRDNGNAAIGNIKGGEVMGLIFPVKHEEIHNESQDEAVNQISEGTCDDESIGQREIKGSLQGFNQEIKNPSTEKDRQQEEENLAKPFRAIGHKTKSSSGIFHISEAEKTINDRNGLAKVQSTLDCALTQLISNDEKSDD